MNACTLVYMYSASSATTLIGCKMETKGHPRICFSVLHGDQAHRNRRVLLSDRIYDLKEITGLQLVACLNNTRDVTNRSIRRQ